MSGDLPSDGLPTRRLPGAGGDARSSLQSKRWSYTRKCLGALVGCTALGLLVVDHGVLARIESARDADAESRIQLATRNWELENASINENNKAKISSDPEEWVWRSQGFPTTAQRTRSHRILVVGDSFVWGDGYANMNDLWWRQLERELRRRGYDDVEVIALGHAGASTRMELDHLRTVLPRYRPDLVVWGYVTNDADEGRIKQFDYERLRKDKLVDHHHRHAKSGWLRRLHFQLEQRRRETLLKRLAGPKRGYEYNEWELQLLAADNLAVYQQTVRDVAGFMREAGTPYFFLSLPNHPSDEVFRPRYAPIKAIFADAGVPLTDVLDDFIAAYPAGTQLSNDLGWGINPANAHPGVVAARFYAREAADQLERSYASVLGPRGAPQMSAAPGINDWMPGALAVQQNAAGRIRFEYPGADAKMLRMPLGEDHVQLHLSMPSNLREIRLAGPALAAAQIHLTQVSSQDGIDYGKLESEPRKSGSQLTWELPAAGAQLVNTVRVVAAFSGADRSLTLELVAKAR